MLFEKKMSEQFFEENEPHATGEFREILWDINSRPTNGYTYGVPFTNMVYPSMDHGLSMHAQ